MRDIFSILSQLGWGLTVGALGAAIAVLAKAGVAVFVLAGGCGFWWWKRRSGRSGARPADSGSEPDQT